MKRLEGMQGGMKGGEKKGNQIKQNNLPLRSTRERERERETEREVSKYREFLLISSISSTSLKFVSLTNSFHYMYIESLSYDISICSTFNTFAI